MKKVLLSILICVITTFTISAQLPKIELVRLDTTTAQPCDTNHYRLEIYSPTLPISLYSDTIDIDFANGFTGFSATSSHPFTMTTGTGFAKIIIDSIYTNDTVFIFYQHAVPCAYIVDNWGDSLITRTERIKVNRRYYSTGIYSSETKTLNFGVGYANLYISPSVPNSYSHLSTLSNIGETINRTIVLESNSSRGVDFDGFINISDNVINSCNLYKIDSIIVTRVNTSTSIPTRTILFDIGYIPSRLPNTGYLLVSHLPVHLEADDGEYLEVREVVRLVIDSMNSCIDNCSNNRIESNLRIDYGCDSTTLCRNTQTNAYIYRSTNRPKIEEVIYSDVSSWDSACFRNPAFTSIPAPSEYINYKHVIKNTGSSTAFDINFILRSTDRTSEILLKSAVEARLNGVLLDPNLLTYYLSPPSRDTNVMPTCAKSFMQLAPSDTDMYSPLYNITWQLAQMEAGDSIVVSYKTYRCCPSDINKIVGNFSSTEYFDTWRINGYLDNIDNISQRHIGIDECGDELVFEIDPKEGILLADMKVNGIQGPAHLTGVNGTCDPGRTAYYQIPILSMFEGSTAGRNEALLATIAGGTISGQLIIEVNTELGLSPIPSSISPMYLESSFVSGSVLRFGFIDSASYDSTGGIVRIIFDLDSLYASGDSSNYARLLAFMTEGYLHLPITPCCNGLPEPNVEVRIYLLPNRGISGSCISCKIPIAKTSRKIFLHCPGCVTPGVIVDKCTVKRITTGYPDTNNDGLANSTIPYSSIDAITRNRFAGNSYIAGDEIRLNFEAFAQDGDDSGYIHDGYTYATLRNNWQALHAIDVNHPTEFTHLYIYVSNPCADTDRFNWGVQTDTLKWERGGGLSGQTLLSPYFVHGANKLMYRIPVSAIGDSISMSDIYKVAMTFKACGNSGASECEISTFMWWCADSMMRENAIDSFQLAGDINEAYSDSSDTVRIAQATPSRIYLCEASGDLINAYKLKREYNSTWENEADPDFNTSPSCNKKLITNYSIRAVAIDESIVNLFPYEYRPLAMDFVSDYFRFPSTVVPNYVLSSIRNNSLYPTWSSGTTLVNIRNTELGTYDSTSTHGTYTLPIGSAIARDSSPPTSLDTNFIYGDERNHLRITYDFVPTTCATPGTVQHIAVNQNQGVLTYYYCEGDTILDTLNETNTSGYNVRTPNPRLQVIQSSGPVTVYSVGENCFRIRLKNNTSSNQVANNVWLQALSPNLGGVITSITEVASSAGVDTTSIVGDTSGGMTAYINHLSRRQYIELEICFEINNCIVPNFIQLNYGYSCIDTLSCKTDSIRINLYPTQVDITHTPTSETIIQTQQCNLDTIECAFSLVYPGDVDHIGIGIHVPTGVQILGADATYTIIGPPLGASDTLHIETSTETITTSGRNIYYTFDDDTALHGTPTRDRNEIEIGIKFIFGSCIDNEFTPTIYMIGQSFCNTTVQDSVTNIRIRPTHNVCPNIVLLADTIINATCNGSYDGSIRLVDTSGSAGLGIVSYVWSSSTGLLADTGLYIDSLLAGTYTVTATDGYGCSATASFVVGAGYVALPHPTIITPYTTCDSINTFVISDNFDTTKYQYWWEANNTVQQRDTIIDSSFVVMMNTPDSACNMIVYIRDKQTLCIDTMRIDILNCCLTNSSITGGGVPIISNTTLTNYIHDHGHIINNWAYRINGVFTIDTNYMFNGLDLYMEPFSSIVLNTGVQLIIDSCHIEACDTVMWYGFSIPNNTCTITMKRSYMSDAIIGIDAKGGAVCNISNSKLKLNRNGVVFSVYNGINPSIIVSDTFITADNTDDFPNVFHDKLLHPFNDQIGLYGIMLENNTQLQVGDSIGGIKTRNIFENLHDGIYAYHSNLRVQNCNFKNMKKLGSIGTDTYNFGNGVEYRTANSGTGSNKWLHVRHCIMDSLDNAGVYLIGPKQNDTIEYNTMNRVWFGVYATGLGSKISGTGIPTGYTYTSVRHNKINYGTDTYIHIAHTALAGVKLNNLGKVFGVVSNNIITSLVSNNTSVEAGIFASCNLASNRSPKLVINNNIIYNGRYGIHMLNLVKSSETTVFTFPTPSITTYFENKIQGDSIYSIDSKNNYCGIYMQNAHDFNIGSNYIVGRIIDTSSTQNKRGIALNASKYNRVYCNRMDKLKYGFYYSGDCQMKNRLYGNNFDTLGYHIYGRNPSTTVLAFLKDQISVDDGTTLGATQFPANRMNVKAYRNSIHNENTSTGVFQWDYKPFPSSFDPAFRSPSTPIGVSLINSSFINNYTCPSSGGGGSGGGSLLADTTEEASSMLASSKMIEQIADEESQGAKQMSEEYIYEKLKNEPELLEVNDSLREYFEDKQINYIGTLDEIKEGMSNSEYAIVSDILEAIEPNEYQQEADKIVYTILNNLEQRENYKLTETELNDLLIVADYCPIRYGDAVYMARTLINSQEGYEAYGWDDEELCIEGVTYRIGNPEIAFPVAMTEGNAIRVYPNPAKNILYFDISENNTIDCKEIKGYCIKSINGKIISSKSYNETIISGAIDISSYADGVYIIEIECSDASFTNIKFIINK